MGRPTGRSTRLVPTGEITVDPKTDPNAESSSSSSSSSSSVEEEEVICRVDFRWRSHDGFPDFNAGGMCGSCDDMFFGGGCRMLCIDVFFRVRVRKMYMKICG